MLALVEDSAEALAPLYVQPGSSRRQVGTDRSMIAFILGIR